MPSPTTYTVTAALPYANGPIHIGHLAGVYIPADIYARYLRLQNKKVLFISGSDEHGVPITIRAEAEKTTPQAIVDKNHLLNKKSLAALGISFDVFSRTSSPIHYQTAADFFTKLHQKGILFVQEQAQYYDPIKKQFLADRYIRGNCPKCGYTDAYGDQCEACGTTLSPQELIQPRSALSGAAPILKNTKHWYLPLQNYESWLKEWILVGHQDWKTNVYGQCKSWLEQGLQPRAVTRDLTWGIPVPLPEAHDKVLYVWFDAPIGYISATKEWAQANHESWEQYWQDPTTQLVHFLGKDNIVFHCIIFPVMLRAHGDFILPAQVVANEFMGLAGDKISTSRNHAIWLPNYLEAFPGKEDVLRYVLCANAPETKDADFTWEDFQARNNNELVATLGNFVNRVFVLTDKYYQGQVPARNQSLTEVDQQLLANLKDMPAKIEASIEHFKFKDALHHWMELARWGNKYLAETTPWHAIKEDPESVKNTLNISLQVIASIAIMGEPFLPFTCLEIKKILNLQETNWQQAGSIDNVKPGTLLGKPKLLFEYLDDEKLAKLQASLL